MNPTQDSGDNFHQTYLKDCNCDNGGIIIHDGIAVCRWCRTPYAKGGGMFYEPKNFKASQPSSREGKDEVDWEIVTVRNKYHNTDKTFDTLWYDGRRTINGQNYDYVLNCLDHKYTIESVRRISDNTTWTVGDVLNGWGKIEGFKIQSDKWILAVCKQNRVFMEEWEKEPVKEVLFKDYAGNEVLKGNVFFAIQKETFNFLSCAHYPLLNPNDWVIFKEESTAREYVLMNKPCLSVNDVKEYIEKHYDYTGGINVGMIKELAKQKTNL